MNEKLALLALLFILASPPAAAQTISIDSVPPYGTLGSITGTVTGVGFASHHVATFIHIEGAGWWTKPSDTMPTVPIDGLGSFSANVGTGGSASLDSLAVIFCAALLPASVTPEAALGDVRIPASLSPLALDCTSRYGRTLSFAGFLWAVKEAPLAVGPGNNVFSDRLEDVYVDSEGLHLRVAPHDGKWWATEVILLASLGHGTYTIQTSSELDDLDIAVTFGIFTWDPYGDDDDIPAAPNREIDFEDSRWGIPSDPTNAQMVVQPYTNAGNLRRYTLPDLSMGPALTRSFSWQPDSIEFVALRGHHAPTGYPEADVIEESLFVHDPPTRFVPVAGRESMRLNLWLNGGASQPAGGQAIEVVVTDMTYVPEPGRWLSLLGGVALLWKFRERRATRLWFRLLETAARRAS